VIFQVYAGEQVTSAHAMDEETLHKLHDFNISFEEDDGPDSWKRKAERPENWAGHSIWIMLLLIYIFAFLCLLCFDEVLNIKWSWIKMEVHKWPHEITKECSSQKKTEIVSEQVSHLSSYALLTTMCRVWVRKGADRFIRQDSRMGSAIVTHIEPLSVVHKVCHGAAVPTCTARKV
jgi:hypothetical protein